MSLSIKNKYTYVCILLPNCAESWTFKNYVYFICNSHSTTMCADSISPGHMLAPSRMANNNWQLSLYAIETAAYACQVQAADNITYAGQKLHV